MNFLIIKMKQEEILYQFKRQCTIGHISQQVTKLFVTKMLRKKYLYKYVEKEKDFLYNYYLGMKTKKAFEIANRIMGVSHNIFQEYTDQLIGMKQLEYKL